MPSSSDHRPKPRRDVELMPSRLLLGDRPAKIAPWDRTPLDRTVRSSRRPLDRTFFVSILAPLEACYYWTDLVAHDPPTTDLSLSQSTSPFPSICDYSLFLLPLSVWPNGFVYLEWFCFDFCFFKSLHIAIFYYKICLEAGKCDKLVENLHFQNVTKYLKLFSNIIFKMQPNIRKYFHLKIFYTQKIFYTEPNTA